MPKKIRMNSQELKLLLKGDKFLNPFQHDRQEWEYVGKGVEAGWHEVLNTKGDDVRLPDGFIVDVTKLAKEVPEPDEFDGTMVLGVLRYRSATVHGNEMKFVRKDYEGLHDKPAGRLKDNHQVVICKKGHEVWYVWFYDLAITVGDEIEIGSY